MNATRQTSAERKGRAGFTMFECVVAASILIVAMSTVTTMAFRLSRVWIDVSHQRIAMNELSNTLETLTQLSTDDVDDAIAALAPSDTAKASLHDPELTGERISDSFGDRIVLQLKWQSSRPIRFVELVGWIDLEESER